MARAVSRAVGKRLPHGPITVKSVQGAGDGAPRLFAEGGLRRGVGGRADVRSQATETRSLRADIRPASTVTIPLTGRRQPSPPPWSAPSRGRYRAIPARARTDGIRATAPTPADRRQARRRFRPTDASDRRDDTVTTVVPGRNNRPLGEFSRDAEPGGPPVRRPQRVLTNSAGPERAGADPGTARLLALIVPAAVALGVVGRVTGWAGRMSTRSDLVSVARERTSARPPTPQRSPPPANQREAASSAHRAPVPVVRGQTSGCTEAGRNSAAAASSG